MLDLDPPTSDSFGFSDSCCTGKHRVKNCRSWEANGLKDLESEAPVLNSEFCIRGLEGRLTFFFGHLLAEIFGAISLCSF